MLMLGMMKVLARAQLRGTAMKCINATFMHSHRFVNNEHSKRSLVIMYLAQGGWHQMSSVNVVIASLEMSATQM